VALYQDFIDQKVDVRWLVPLIQGYVGLQKGMLNGREYQIALISRRSVQRSGTRFNARGIDDMGHVANTVETEQIVVSEGVLTSYSMIRGSVPIFWE